MKSALRLKQVRTIKDIQQKLKGYLLWKKCKTKAKFFNRADLDKYLFHLEIIIDTTVEAKVAKKATQLFKLYKRILKYEYDEEPRTIPYAFNK